MIGRWLKAYDCISQDDLQFAYDLDETPSGLDETLTVSSQFTCDVGVPSHVYSLLSIVSELRAIAPPHVGQCDQYLRLFFLCDELTHFHSFSSSLSSSFSYSSCPFEPFVSSLFPSTYKSLPLFDILVSIFTMRSVVLHQLALDDLEVELNLRLVHAWMVGDPSKSDGFFAFGTQWVDDEFALQPPKHPPFHCDKFHYVEFEDLGDRVHPPCSYLTRELVIGGAPNHVQRPGAVARVHNLTIANERVFELVVSLWVDLSNLVDATTLALDSSANPIIIAFGAFRITKFSGKVSATSCTASRVCLQPSDRRATLIRSHFTVSPWPLTCVAPKFDSLEKLKHHVQESYCTLTELVALFATADESDTRYRCTATIKGFESWARGITMLAHTATRLLRLTMLISGAPSMNQSLRQMSSTKLIERLPPVNEPPRSPALMKPTFKAKSPKKASAESKSTSPAKTMVQSLARKLPCSTKDISFVVPVAPCVSDDDQPLAKLFSKHTSPPALQTGHFPISQGNASFASGTQRLTMPLAKVKIEKLMSSPTTGPATPASALGDGTEQELGRGKRTHAKKKLFSA
ncbi:hypothetical protein LINPERHAP2_LOCUS25522 [Linum perenne]